MAKLRSLLDKGAKAVKKTVKADKIFGKAKSLVGGAKNKVLSSTKGTLSKVRGKMSLVPQALQPPEQITPRANIKRVGRLVENKVQNLVPNLVKSVQSKVSTFDPQAFLGKIFGGGLNSLQNFASGLSGLQSSLKKSLGSLTESKGIIADLIEKMAKAKPQKSKGGLLKGLLKGAAVVGLGALAVKAAPAALGVAGAIGGGLFKGSALGGGLALAKNVFGRKKKELNVDGTKSEVTKQFKESLEKFDEALSLVEMQFKGKISRKNINTDPNNEEDPEEEEESAVEGKGDDDTGLKNATDDEQPDGKPPKDKDKSVPTTVEGLDSNFPLPDPDKKADENFDSLGRPVPIGTVVGGDDMQPSTVEPLTDPTSTFTGQGGPDLVLKPQTIEFLKGNQGVKGNRGALGSKGDPGIKPTTASSGTPMEPIAEMPKPQGLMRGLAGMGDMLSFGMTDFDKRGDIFKDKSKADVPTETMGDLSLPKLEIAANLRNLEALGQVTDGISQPVGQGNKTETPPVVSIPVPVGGGGNQTGKYKMSRMENEAPILLAVDPSNIHLTTTKSLLNIMDAL